MTWDGRTPAAAHPDDAAVDRFAAAMKDKLARKRGEGRGGWEDKSQCSAEHLSRLLHDHVAKGDPVDVGNLAMMLHQRGERITLATVPQDALRAEVPALIERLYEWQNDHLTDDNARDWMGHVEPARARVSALLATPPAPQDAPPPALVEEIERILDEKSAWIARPDKDVSRAVAVASACAALRIMGAWEKDETSAVPQDVREDVAEALCKAEYLGAPVPVTPSAYHRYMADAAIAALINRGWGPQS